MTFAEEVGEYRFRFLGPRFRSSTNGHYVLPRGRRSVATVLESPQLVLQANNVHLGPVEAELKAPLHELGAIATRSTLACGAVVNAAVRHMAEDLAFVDAGGSDDFLFLAGLLRNEPKTCVRCANFSEAESPREVFRTRFDERRGARHTVVDHDCRTYLAAGNVPPIGVFLHDTDRPYEHQLDTLHAAEPFFAETCLVILADANRDAPRAAALDFIRGSARPWQLVLDERTAGDHPTLWNGVMVLQGGSHQDTPVKLATETRLVDPLDVRPSEPDRDPPTVSVLHYRNPSIGVQDYPHLEVIALEPGESVKEPFEHSTGRYVVVVDGDVELTPDALSQAVRAAEGGPAVIRCPSPAGAIPDRTDARWHRPLTQAEYFPSWSGTFDDAHEPQTVTVARALSVARDNLVALDIDPRQEDPRREIAVRLGLGPRLEGPAARCSRVPDGVVAGRVGAVLTPDGAWLLDSVGAAGRAWPTLAIDDRGRVALTERPRESDECVAAVVSEVQRTWWTARYGHWTFDVLTRVAMLLRAGAPADVKLLVPDPVLDFQRETLVGLGIAEDRIIPWDGRPTRFRAVYVPTARPAPPFVFPAGVELLRELVARPRATPGRRLYVSRRELGRTPRISNERELFDVAANFGFVEVMPETLPYSEQLRLFSEAEAVAGPHGSGLANAIYMPRRTGLCELAPAGLHDAKVPNFWDLAACGGQHYGVCVGPGNWVDPKYFKWTLRQVTRSGQNS